MPFADIGCIIAVSVKVFGKGYGVFFKRYTVPITAILSCILTCLQAGSCRAAHRLTGEGVIEDNTVFTKLPHVWHKIFVKSVPTLLVGKVKDNVRLSKNQQGRLDRNTAFPYITKANFVANYTNNLINIESATAKINNSVLFEDGNEYNLQFGLAQYSQDDGYFNLIPIEVNNQSYVTYNRTDEKRKKYHEIM